MRSKVNVKFHRLRNGFFPKAVKRLTLYLMGNGATLDDAIKAKIDRKFDNTMILGAINACIDGVVWGFPDLITEEKGTLTFFRATEFVPLVDERTSKAMAGIRFWQLSADKPMYIELYEVDGITEYVTNESGGGLTETTPKRPYKQTVRQDAFTTTVINGENYGVLPVFPLYANELKTSELTTGLQALIDAYDFISSDLVDGITLIEGIYWIVKNFGGQDTAQLLTELQELKATLVDGADTGADSHVIEIPFQAKQTALELLESRMYSDWLLPSEMRLGGARAVTATEIKAAREDMDIKADLLEWQIAAFVEEVLKLKGHDEILSDYKRRTLNNDTETVNNLVALLSAGAIDEEELIFLLPIMPEDRKDALLERIKLREAELDSMKFPADDSAIGNNA